MENAQTTLLNLCQDKLTKYIGEDAKISTPITESLKIKFDFEESYLTIKPDFSAIDRMDYRGEYGSFKFYVRQILACIRNNEYLFRELINESKNKWK